MIYLWAYRELKVWESDCKTCNKLIPSGGNGRQWHSQCDCYDSLFQCLVLVHQTCSHQCGRRQPVAAYNRQRGWGLRCTCVYRVNPKWRQSALYSLFKAAFFFFLAELFFWLSLIVLMGRWFSMEKAIQESFLLTTATPFLSLWICLFLIHASAT